MNQKLVNDLIQAQNVIRKKYKSIKEGRLESVSRFEDIFQPITGPLKKLAENPSVKPELKSEPPVNANFITPSMKKRMRKKKKNIQLENESKPMPDPILSDFNRDLREESDYNISTDMRVENQDLQQQEVAKDIRIDPINSTDYFIRSLNINHQDFDNKYGPYFNIDVNAWKIGSSSFIMDKANIFINDVTYKLTDGLKKLIFLKKPNINLCDSNDVSNYIEIIKSSNLLHRSFDQTRQLAGNKSFKYKLIKRLGGKSQETSHLGSGLMQYSTNKSDYVYWDNPNELIDRLRLLLASQQAGHNNHNNEIISILEELREARIII